ncbi:MAG TPA: hypothetical protein VMU09_02205, partial [Acidimicrobiales bacterium]|nr:hypothetical protein [Acidimicrobiales bacterium]
PAPEEPGTVGSVGSLDLLSLQRVLGAYQWIERRTFEVLGAWVATEGVAQARVLFDVQSQQHAWHAELFAERMPSIEGTDAASYVLPPTAEVDRLFASVGGGPGAPGDAARGASGGTLLRLVGLSRVLLPRLIAGYGLHLARCAPVADAPLSRALRLALRDDLEAWQATEATVQSLVRRPHDLAVVTAHQQALEELVAGTGTGLVPWSGGPA